MPLQRDVNPQTDSFVVQARRRLHCVQEMLLAWQHDPQTHLGTAERALRQQAAESQRAGYQGIAGLCGDLADCLAVSRSSGHVSTDTPDVLLDACQNLRLYLEVVAQGMVSSRSRHGERERGLFDASEGA